MHQEIIDRYAGETADWTEEELAADEAAHFAEVTPEQTRRPLGAFLVARIDGEPAGCGALKPLGDGTATGEIKPMYPVPAHRRGRKGGVAGKRGAVRLDLGGR